MRPPDIPFQVIALAPFRPKEVTPWRDEPIKIDSTEADKVMAGLGITLSVPLPEQIGTDRLLLGFTRLKDFHPDSLVTNNPFLENLLKARQFAEDAKRKGEPDERIYERLKEWPDLPFEIRSVPKKKKEPPSRAVDEILKLVAMPEEDPSPRTEAGSFIDQFNAVLNPIVHHIYAREELRALESVWRGLRFFLKEGGTNGEITLKIVPVSFDTLEETLDLLFPRLAQDLPSLIIIDLPFDSSPRSHAFLEKIAGFSETLLVPTIFWITEQFLYLEKWGDLARLPFLPHYMEGQAFAKWRNFRETSPARWVAATCNRFLVRYPYGPDNRTARVDFVEPEGLFAGPVWAAATLIGKSQGQTGWPTRFTNWQDIRLENLPLREVEGKKLLPTEFHMSDDRLDQFLKSGITPLVAPHNKDIAFMPSEQTVAGGSLKYQLFLSRITRFLFWCRDNFAKDLDPAEVEKNLHRAFSLLWEKTGHPGPETFEISITRPKPDEPPVARFMIKPPRQILPSGETIELDFHW